MCGVLDDDEGVPLALTLARSLAPFDRSFANSSAPGTTITTATPRPARTTMTDSAQRRAIVLDGKATSAKIHQDELVPACAAFLEQHDRRVGLAVVVVGARKDSATYVRMKQRACTAAGIESWKVHIPMPEGVDVVDLGDHVQKEVVQELLDTIQKLNAREDVDGIIVQLPLPSFCDEDAILATVAPEKDVDGLHPESHAALFQFATKKAIHSKKNSGNHHEEAVAFNIPCTPAGCIELLDTYGIPLEGKRVVVLGRSQIVGLPVSMLCLHRNATITICHSRTEDLKVRAQEADILIAAIGRAHFVKGDWIKPGATVIDVGINAVDDASKAAGYRLVGDVDYEEVSKVAHAVTPVPGGVGPMTVSMLLRNTVQTAYRRKRAAADKSSS